MDKINIVALIFDQETIKGLFGSFAAITLPAIDVIGSSLQTLGSAGGLLLLGVSIYHKVLQVKQIKKPKKNTTDGNS